jgi:hypothetical protein
MHLDACQLFWPEGDLDLPGTPTTVYCLAVSDELSIIRLTTVSERLTKDTPVDGAPMRLIVTAASSVPAPKRTV